MQYQTIGPTTWIRANPRHVQSAVRDEVVLLGIGTGDYYALNPVGVRIWGLLQSERRLGDLVACLVAEYDVDEATAHGDVLAMLEDLDRHGLIELRDGA